jgi:DNA repair exonuclease SbcCD ATPase subunit
MDSSDLDNLISELADIAEDAASGERRYQEVWNEIKQINDAFKKIRYPTKTDRDDAWQQFQQIINRVKKDQQRHREEWDEKAERSRQLKNSILRQGEYGRPPNAFESAIGEMIIGPIAAVAELYVDMITLGQLRGEIDEKKEELKHYSNELRKAWDEFNDNKDDMLGKDKHEVFNSLREIQEQLDAAWEEWRKLNGHYHEASKDAFRERVEGNIAKLESRLENLYSILSKKESHLSELEEKRDSAWNDDFRDRVEGWIDEEEDRIRDIRDQIHQVEGWLDEERGKL